MSFCREKLATYESAIYVTALPQFTFLLICSFVIFGQSKQIIIATKQLGYALHLIPLLFYCSLL